MLLCCVSFFNLFLFYLMSKSVFCLSVCMCTHVLAVSIKAGRGNLVPGTGITLELEL